jgi:signal transduction histidine kinase
MIYLQAAIDEENHARSHQMLVDALDQADEVLVEGRERVRSLRTEAMLPYELSQALNEYGMGHAQEQGVKFSTTVVGNSRLLDPMIRDEAFHIGREALANAFQHSRATKIELGLTYDRKNFRLSVKDNGIGVEPPVLKQGKPGHWGLRGMRERAKRVSAQLEISSQATVGTEVIVTIPSRVAFPHHLRFASLFWRTQRPDRELG